MTRITHHHTRSAVRLRQLGVGLLVAGSVLAVTATDRADARPRSESEVVAAQAGRALDAFSNWRLTQHPADYVRFVQARQSAATIIATELEIDPEQLRQEWAVISSEKQEAVLAALTQLGVPYRNLKSQPGVGFDCSGLTIWAFDQAGVEIPRSSRYQFRAADEIDHDQAEAGDLVYYPGHIAIYLGADAMIHSPNSGSHVQVVTLPTRKSLRYGDVVSPAMRAEALSTVEPMSTTLVDWATPVAQ